MPSARATMVPRQKSPVFWSRASELRHASKGLLQSGSHQAAAVLAVQAAISGVDALTIELLGKRSTGQDHREAGRLLREVQEQGVAEQSDRFISLMEWKRLVDYEDRLVSAAEAERIVLGADRLLSWIARLLKRGPR